MATAAKQHAHESIGMGHDTYGLNCEIKRLQRIIDEMELLLNKKKRFLEEQRKNQRKYLE
ncbi:hypothetical protein GVAV_003401 [Gurleya vavrai]